MSFVRIGALWRFSFPWISSAREETKTCLRRRCLTYGESLLFELRARLLVRFLLAWMFRLAVRTKVSTIPGMMLRGLGVGGSAGANGLMSW